MDPNANIDQQLELAKKITTLVESDEPLERFAEKLEELAGELATRVEALDHWITGGGYLPERWSTDVALKARPDGRPIELRHNERKG